MKLDVAKFSLASMSKDAKNTTIVLACFAIGLLGIWGVVGAVLLTSKGVCAGLVATTCIAAVYGWCVAGCAWDEVKQPTAAGIKKSVLILGAFAALFEVAAWGIALSCYGLTGGLAAGVILSIIVGTVAIAMGIGMIADS